MQRLYAANRPAPTIGMGTIKQRRLNELFLSSHFGLNVGDCVPFYFCPRSVMLYLIWRANDPELTYRGQAPIVHLEADLHQTVAWAESQNLRWALRCLMPVRIILKTVAILTGLGILTGRP